MDSFLVRLFWFLPLYQISGIHASFFSFFLWFQGFVLLSGVGSLSIDNTKPEDSIAAVRDASYYGRNIGEDYPLVCSVPNEDKGSIDIIFSDVHPKTGELGRDLAYNASYYRKECLICTENEDGTFELVPRQSRKQ